MSLTLIASPEKTINGLLSNVNAGRSQLPYLYQEDDIQPGYKLEVQIWDALNTTQLLPLTFRFSPEGDGRLFVDIGQILTNLQEFGLEASLEYILRYNATYEGSVDDWISTPVIQSLYAKKQIGLVGGSNMWEHLLRDESVPTTAGDAKLLTKFISTPPVNGGLAPDDENLKMWRGWRRTVGYLVDSELGNRINLPLRSVIQIAARNKTSGGANETINQGGTIPMVGVVEINDLGGYYTSIRMTETNAAVPVSAQLFYEVHDECPQPVMIQWLNSLGAPEQHLFNINQEVNIEASPGLAYEKTHTQDQEQIYADKTRIFSEDTQSMLLTAQDLTKNQIKALAEIKTSPQVEVFLNRDGSERVGVICREALATPYDSKGTRQEFRLAIEFPDNFIFEESKQY